MTCIGSAPATLQAWLDTVNRCATAAGGADWPSLALTGAATLVVLVFAVLAVGAVVVRVGR